MLMLVSVISEVGETKPVSLSLLVTLRVLSCDTLTVQRIFLVESFGQSKQRPCAVHSLKAMLPSENEIGCGC